MRNCDPCSHCLSNSWSKVCGIVPPLAPNIDDNPLPPEAVLDPPVLLDLVCKKTQNVVNKILVFFFCLTCAITLWCNWGPIKFPLFSFGLNMLCASNSEFKWSVIFWAIFEFGFSWFPIIWGADNPFWNLQIAKKWKSRDKWSNSQFNIFRIFITARRAGYRSRRAFSSFSLTSSWWSA